MNNINLEGDLYRYDLFKLVVLLALIGVYGILLLQ
jgi:hypothetical protein